MAKPQKQHLYIPFSGATIIDRAHEREVKPPGFVELDNFIPPRSDGSPTLRPDISQSNDYVYSIREQLVIDSDTDFVDGIAGATGIFGNDQLIYFTTFIPYGYSDGAYSILCDTHSDGTCVGTAGSTKVVGDGTKFNELAYRGAVVRFEADNSSYAGNYAGGVYTFTASGVSGLYYLELSSGGDPGFLGTGGITNITYHGTSYSNVDIETISGISAGDVAYGDLDANGFNTLYIGSPTDDPNKSVESNKKVASVEFGLNISGSNVKWTQVGATNEYYIEALAGGDPGLWGESISTEYDSRYGHINGTSAVRVGAYGNIFSYMRTDVGEGTAGSLSEYDGAVALDPTASYSTFYFRNDDGSPELFCSSQPSGILISLSTQIDFTGVSYEWKASTALGENVFYLQASGGGDPNYGTAPYIFFDGVKGTRVTSSPLVLDAQNEYGFGDEDTLGYNTIYVYRTDGTPGVSDVEIIGHGTMYITSTPYKWTQVGVTNEWYLELLAGGDPSVDEPAKIYLNYASTTKGTAGSLGEKQWAWDQDPGASFDTIYIYSATNPNQYSTSGADSSWYIPLGVLATYEYDVYASEYKWTLSGGGTNEYYLTLTDGSDPSVSTPTDIYIDGSSATEGTLGSLSDGQWDYGHDVGDVSFDTIYIRSNSGDPDGAVGDGTSYSDVTAPTMVDDVLAEGSGYDYYVVDHIVNDEEMYLNSEIANPINGAPEFYYSHNAYLTDNKLNIQSYTTGIIYGTSSLVNAIREDDISGPFYLGLTSSGLGETTVTTNSKWEYFVTDVSESEEHIIRNGANFEFANSLAYGNGRWIQCYPTVNIGTQVNIAANYPGRIALSYGIANGTWLEYLTNTIGATFEQQFQLLTITGDGDQMSLNSVSYDSGKFIGACQVLENTACHPGIAYTTNGVEWVTASDVSVSWGDITGKVKQLNEYQAISAAYDGTTVVMIMYRQSDDAIKIRYSTDLGAAWSDAIPASTTNGSPYTKVKVVGEYFVIVNGSEYLYSSNGQTFFSDSGPSWDLVDVDYGDGKYAFADKGLYVRYTTGIGSSLTSVSLESLDAMRSVTEMYHIHYDQVGTRWIVNTQYGLSWSDDLTTWKSRLISLSGSTKEGKEPTNIAEAPWLLSYTMYEDPISVLLTRFDYTFWDVSETVVLSEVYRASSFSVIDGYVVLFGTREWEEILDDDDAGTGEYQWVYYPRRARWTAPATYNDFESTGAGLADAPGDGRFIESRPVNGRVLIFETNRVSALVPRGDFTDPFDYDVVEQDFRIISNPVVVNEKVFVIGDDGLMYISDGINIQEAGMSFDATKFDDYNEKFPIGLSYCSATNSLVVDFYDASSSVRSCHHIGVETGLVTKNTLPNVDNRAVTSRYITPIINSSDKRILVSYPASSDDYLRVGAYQFNRPITGIDDPDPSCTNPRTYWYATMETGELFLQPEGLKTSLKHMIFKTYCGTSINIEQDDISYPDMFVEIYPTGQSYWRSRGSFIFNTRIGQTTSDSTSFYVGEPSTKLLLIGDGGSDLISGFWHPERATFFLYDGSYTYTALVDGTDYTYDIGATDVTIVSPPAVGEYIYGNWSFSPEPTIETGDYIRSPEGIHKITGQTVGAFYLDLDWYTINSYDYTQDTQQFYHYKPQTLGDGDYNVTFGFNDLVEGVRVRAVVVPSREEISPTIVKLVGVTIGHVPQGTKTLTATGA